VSAVTTHMYRFPKISAVSKNSLPDNPYIKRICANVGITKFSKSANDKINVHKLDAILAKTDMGIADRLNFKIALRNAGLLD
jgi:hypothetical protein